MSYIIIVSMIILLSMGIIIIRSNYERKQLKSYNYSINTNKIDKDITLKYVMLSDLHSKVYGYNNEKIVTMIEQEEPDAIFIAGDMIIGNRTDECSVSISLFRELTQICPVYYGNGNHEQRMKDYPHDLADSKYNWYKNKLQTLGVIFLDSSNTEVLMKGQKIYISGLELDYKYFGKFVYNKLPISEIIDSVGESKSNAYNVLLAHNPVHLERYQAWGADLVLSGHLHGGFIQIPFLGGVLSPQVSILPRYSGGMYEVVGCSCIVSRGLGEHTLPIRINNFPEISVIKVSGIE